MAEVVRTLAHAVLALSAAGALYSAGALAIQAAGPRLSHRGQELCWRLLGVKLAGVANHGGRDHRRMMLSAVISSTQAPHAKVATAIAGVLVGLIWLTALGLATTAGSVSLRDRTLPSPPPNPWTTRTAWTLAAAFIATIGVLATAAAS